MASQYIKLPAEGGGGGAVDSFNGRTGAVVPQAGDYDASEIDYTPSGDLEATDVQEALDELEAEKQSLDFIKSYAIAYNDFPTNDYVPFSINPFNGGFGARSVDIDSRNHPGQVKLNTDANPAGGVSINAGEFIPGNGFVYRAWVYLPDLSDGTDEYEVIAGTYDTQNGAAPTNGIYFKYKRTVSTNWLACTSASTTETETSTGVAVAADAWVALKAVVADDRSSVQYYIDETLVATLTTNIPANTAYGYIGVKIAKTAGTNSRAIYVDAIYFRMNVTR